MDPNLESLAAAYGVATSYVDQGGVHVEVSEDTVLAVLAALGTDLRTLVDRSSAIAAAAENMRLRDWCRMLPPVIVATQGISSSVWVHVRDGAPARAHVITEGGRHVDLAQIDNWNSPVEVDDEMIGEASFAIPADLPLGWHTLYAESDDRQAETSLVMTPARLDPEAIAGSRQWGFMAQVYATRSRESWGIGDLHDLATLASWSGRELGAGFVLINPLHAATPVSPIENSPYLPVTRRFTNPIYLHVEDIPEFGQLKKKQRRKMEEAAAPLRAMNLTAGLIDRDAVWAIKRQAFGEIFDLGLSKSRRAEFDEYCAAQGIGLRDFATWCAMSEVFGSDSSDWSAEYSRPDAPAVAAFRKNHAEVVEFQMWMQWQMDQQLAHTQDAARDAGMAIGVMADLAVGVHPSGADSWSLHDVLARGVSVGAPPDMYNQMGQDWSQPPWRPDALAEAGYLPYRDLLRTILRHAGGLRIDHVLGLFRLWWVPSGMGARNGTFVRFDHDAMIGILCLEAQRAGAIVVGEDLGTVEPWVRDVLAARGILGTVISWFERTDGVITPLDDWRQDILASVTVHDLPPTAGFLRDEHVRIRESLGLLTADPAVEYANARRDREQWAALLRGAGFLESGADLDTDAGRDAMAIALHRAVGSTKARLVGIGLPDVVGDRRAQNQPGTYLEYPNWRVPMTDSAGRPVLLEDVIAGPELLGPMVDAMRQR
ncbi:MAG: 4-alpha-glucanotransferase [Candidatus Nanopelagicales bacterium]